VCHPIQVLAALSDDEEDASDRELEERLVAEEKQSISPAGVPAISHSAMQRALALQREEVGKQQTAVKARIRAV
jgi:hypothetical protein